MQCCVVLQPCPPDSSRLAPLWPLTAPLPCCRPHRDPPSGIQVGDESLCSNESVAIIAPAHPCDRPRGLSIGVIRHAGCGGFCCPSMSCRSSTVTIKPACPLVAQPHPLAFLSFCPTFLPNLPIDSCPHLLFRTRTLATNPLLPLLLLHNSNSPRDYPRLHPHRTALLRVITASAQALATATQNKTFARQTCPSLIFRISSGSVSCFRSRIQ